MKQAVYSKKVNVTITDHVDLHLSIVWDDSIQGQHVFEMGVPAISDADQERLMKILCTYLCGAKVEAPKAWPGHSQKTGEEHIIDLAERASCAFLESGDWGAICVLTGAK